MDLTWFILIIETYMGDMVMIRGLDVDRSKNLS